jgi:DNA replication protein DnaC
MLAGETPLKNLRRAQGIIALAKKCPAEHIDDRGIKKLPATVVQDFYDILEERFATPSTIITSQIPLENWKEVIEDPVALEAIVDRLIYGAVRLKLEGESMRKKRVQSKAVDTP